MPSIISWHLFDWHVPICWISVCVGYWRTCCAVDKSFTRCLAKKQKVISGKTCFFRTIRFYKNLNSSLSFGQAALSFCLLRATSCLSKLVTENLPGPLLIGFQVSCKSYLPSKKIHLSQCLDGMYFLSPGQVNSKNRRHGAEDFI